MSYLKILLVMLVLTSSLWCADNFEIVETWNHESQPLGRTVLSLADKDGHVIALFYKTGRWLITPKKAIKFAPVGQGPSDLQNVFAMFPHNGDIAFMERAEKIKIFTKKDGAYVWKQTLWPKRGKYAYVISDGLFYDHKWFISGFETLGYPKEGDKDVSFLKIYDEKMQPVKNLLKRTFNNPNKFYLMNYHLTAYKDNVFFIAENELKVHVISVKGLEVKREVKLEEPGFYKKMPADFYAWKTYTDPKDSFERDLEKWKSSYCRINKVVVEDNSLVLQVRTRSEQLKTFALLFYNPETFKLEKTIYTNDLLLGSRNGKYYFFAGGDPAFDEVENFTIHIYSFNKKK